MLMHVENRIIPEGSNYLGKIERNCDTFITIHESSLGTGLATPDRTIDYYEGQLLNPPAGREKVGYHFMCDDERCVQFIPLSYRTAHAGSTEGNHSIAIERLVNCNVCFPKAISIQAKLTATLMRMYDIPINNVVPRMHWDGTPSPSRLLAGLYGGWDGFIEKVIHFYETNDLFDETTIVF